MNENLDYKNTCSRCGEFFGEHFDDEGSSIWYLLCEDCGEDYEKELAKD